MASYTAAEALDLILGSSKDLESGDESDIEEDPLFPLPLMTLGTIQRWRRSVPMSLAKRLADLRRMK